MENRNTRSRRSNRFVGLRQISGCLLAILLMAASCNGDVTSPTVTSNSPMDEATGIEVTSTIVVTFSEPMDQTKTESAFEIRPTGICEFSWSDDGKALTCDPEGDLQGQTNYEVTVTAGATDKAGNSLTNEHEFSFTTERVVGPGGTVWSKQFGTSTFDFATDVAVDSADNVLITGHTSGATPNESDIFVRKYDSDGLELWSRQFGTSEFEIGGGIAVDAEDNVVVSGHTSGSLEGSLVGEEDALIRKYDPDGNELWTRQFGTGNQDRNIFVSVDALGDILVAGSTDGSLAGNNAGLFDAFVRKYDSDGNEMWTRQFGTADQEFVEGIAVDEGESVIVTGSTRGPLAGSDPAESDVFVRKYDQDGNESWTSQFGTASTDSSEAVTTDPMGNVVVAGSTSGALAGTNSGDSDVFLRKYDPEGSELWTIQFGTSDTDVGNAVVIDGSGNIVLAGVSFGSLGDDSEGGQDIFVRKYDPNRNELWTTQFGTGSDDFAFGVAVDSRADIFVAGGTNGSLERENAGETDVVIRKLAP